MQFNSEQALLRIKHSVGKYLSCICAFIVTYFYYLFYYYLLLRIKWQKVLQLEMMSSEESGTESSEDIYVINLYHGEHPGLQDSCDDKVLISTVKAPNEKKKDISTRQKPEGKFPPRAFI